MSYMVRFANDSFLKRCLLVTNKVGMNNNMSTGNWKKPKFTGYNKSCKPALLNQSRFSAYLNYCIKMSPAPKRTLCKW